MFTCPITEGWKIGQYTCCFIKYSSHVFPIDKWKTDLEKSWSCKSWDFLTILSTFIPVFSFPAVFHDFWPSLYISHKSEHLSDVFKICAAFPFWVMSPICRHTMYFTWMDSCFTWESGGLYNAHTEHLSGSLPLLPYIIATRAWKHIFPFRRWCWCRLSCEHCPSTCFFKICLSFDTRLLTIWNYC